MADCTHDLTERDVAVTADGMCPLCLVAEVERLRAENTRLALGQPAVEANKKLLARAERAEAGLGEARRLLKSLSVETLCDCGECCICQVRAFLSHPKAGGGEGDK